MKKYDIYYFRFNFVLKKENFKTFEIQIVVFLLYF